MAPHIPYRDDPEASMWTEDETDTETTRDLHIHSSRDESSDPQTVPAWLKPARKGLPALKLPQDLSRFGHAIANFVKGPDPPRVLRIEPIFPKVQEAPVRLLEHLVPKKRHRACVLIVFFAIWFIIWSIMLKFHVATGHIEGYGKPNNIWCGHSFWNDGNGCGLNGNDCRPFQNQYLAFKCQANCASVIQRNRHIIGNESLQFSQQVIGGPSMADPKKPAVYRGDSFICQAAIHAGVITDSSGGCGVALLVGTQENFEASEQHGIQSHAFPSDFPRSFIFPELDAGAKQCPSGDRWGMFVVTAVALVLLSLFTSSPAAFFWGTFVILMFHVGLVSDPPNKANFNELLSTLMGRLLPASFVAAIMYRWCARPLLTGLTAQIEKTMLYLGFVFLGALNNYTFAPAIPIARLTPHDLAQPGAKLALAIIVTVIVTIVVTQIHWIRISGNMPRYLVVYGLMGAVLIVLLALPGLRLRIHHYILGILFMPGTAFRVRPSLAYQGLLLGFFINGIARWGFDSIIQTPAALGEGSDGNGRTWWGSSSPNITATVADELITFNWGLLPDDTGIDGVSILINDVERWRGYTDNELFFDQDKITLSRRWRTENATEFYRFAYMNGNNVGRYSESGIWAANGTWYDVPAGN